MPLNNRKAIVIYPVPQSTPTHVNEVVMEYGVAGYSAVTPKPFGVLMLIGILQLLL